MAYKPIDENVVTRGLPGSAPVFSVGAIVRYSLIHRGFKENNYMNNEN